MAKRREPSHGTLCTPGDVWQSRVCKPHHSERTWEDACERDWYHIYSDASSDAEDNPRPRRRPDDDDPLVGARF